MLLVMMMVMTIAIHMPTVGPGYYSGITNLNYLLVKTTAGSSALSFINISVWIQRANRYLGSNCWRHGCAIS